MYGVYDGVYGIEPNVVMAGKHPHSIGANGRSTNTGIAK
jgi:hypothetical protein